MAVSESSTSVLTDSAHGEASRVGINHMSPMPGVRCPKCEEAGKEVWVIPGKKCHVCGALC
ncbi:predicted protein [Uncinocarpus reesii 1704]|uniref:Uncharacterized protein n=1 Tax=Uncinocarpus reesii (strain UAMH 1704) TaxID=336963 RepID=C4JHY3_UNCRE|nr:uncharacterized protein UREG_01408 [Uncinocarpus reesii 1704]EEP76559.1 predicted protein [Uncinocarpus reesii 1704]